MKKSRWASLALASSLVWASGCCCNWCENTCGHRGLLTSRAAQAPCECPPGTVPATALGGQQFGHQFQSAPVYGGSQVHDGMIYAGEGPTLVTPEAFPGAVAPPRIVPVPQANPVPYRP